MEGKEVFKHAVRRMAHASKNCLEKAGLTEEEIAWLVPHQANARIIDALTKQFNIPEERVGKTVHKYGNTSASSLAVTLEELILEKEIKNGDHMLVVAFGAGLTWGAGVLTRMEETR
jgi:3-oxoacyl-[acyl-carrier-protein] synthase-3